jgi:hypothetical protein
MVEKPHGEFASQFSRMAGALKAPIHVIIT